MPQLSASNQIIIYIHEASLLPISKMFWPLHVFTVITLTIEYWIFPGCSLECQYNLFQCGRTWLNALFWEITVRVLKILPKKYKDRNAQKITVFRQNGVACHVRSTWTSCWIGEIRTCSLNPEVLFVRDPKPIGWGRHESTLNQFMLAPYEWKSTINKITVSANSEIMKRILDGERRIETDRFKAALLYNLIWFLYSDVQIDSIVEVNHKGVIV